VAGAYHGLLVGERDIDELEALARAALPLLEQAGDHAGLAHVWEALGFGVAGTYGRNEEMVEASEQELHHARLAGQHPGEALDDLALALLGGPRPADEALRALDALLPESPRPMLLMIRAHLLAMLDRLEEARPNPRRLCELARETGPGGLEGMAAMIATIEGDHETAASYLRQLCDELQELGQRSFLSTFAPLLGRSLCALGRYEEAEPLARLGHELGAEPDVMTQMLWRQVQALVDAHRGEYVEAEALAREAVAIVKQTDALTDQADALCDLAEVLRAAGKDREAAGALVQALERYERKKNLPMARQVRALLESEPAAAG
jgi:tetratricopeptide (TPR) repeat protein